MVNHFYLRVNWLAFSDYSTGCINFMIKNFDYPTGAYIIKF